jgi:hypothetical protein
MQIKARIRLRNQCAVETRLALRVSTRGRPVRGPNCSTTLTCASSSIFTGVAGASNSLANSVANRTVHFMRNYVFNVIGCQSPYQRNLRGGGNDRGLLHRLFAELPAAQTAGGIEALLPWNSNIQYHNGD